MRMRRTCTVYDGLRCASAACYRCIGCMLSASSTFISYSFGALLFFRPLIPPLSVDAERRRRCCPRLFALLALCFHADVGTQPKLFRGGGCGGGDPRPPVKSSSRRRRTASEAKSCDAVSRSY